MSNNNSHYRNKLSEALMGGKIDKGVVVLDGDISAKMLAVSTLALLVLASCSENDVNVPDFDSSEVYEGKEIKDSPEVLSNKEGSQENEVLSNEEASQENEVGSQENELLDEIDDNVVLNVTSYTFHNDGLFVFFDRTFENEIPVSLSYEFEGGLVVRESLIQKGGILDIRGIDDSVSSATVHYGTFSEVFEKDKMLSKESDF